MAKFPFMVAVIICAGAVILSRMQHPIALCVANAAESKDDDVVVQGVVLDQQQQPLADVETNAVVLSHRPKDHVLAGGTIATVVGRTKTDASGRFSMKIRRASEPQDIALELFGYLAGHGIGGRYLEMGRDQLDVSLTLPKESPIAGKLLDPDGQPMAGASVVFVSLKIPDDGAPSYPFSVLPSGITAWPRPIVTGQDGSFQIVGAPLDTQLLLELDDARAARQQWKVTVGDAPKPVTLRTEPPRNVEGTVVVGENRKPIANATVIFKSSQPDGEYIGNVLATTDAEGRFRFRPYVSEQLSIRVNIANQVHSFLAHDIPWPKGTTTQRMVLPIYGKDHKVLDETTPDGQPTSTIETDYPAAPIQKCEPTLPLKAKLTGAIFADVSLAKLQGDSSTPVQGVVAIDPETGNWQLVAKEATFPRVSPSGKSLAFNVDEEQQLLSLEPRTDPRPIAKKVVGPACWIPATDELLLNIWTPAKRDYLGQGYWGEECEVWRVKENGKKLTTVPIPAFHDAYDVSGDGVWIAMHWDTHSINGAQLFIARLDGSDVRPIARKKSQYYWYPRFSPDGKTVVAKHLDPLKHLSSVRIIALDGKSECSIFESAEFSPDSVCWSPDGKYIAVSMLSLPTRQSKLLVVDVEGTQSREVSLVNAGEVRLGTIDWAAERTISP